MKSDSCQSRPGSHPAGRMITPGGHLQAAAGSWGVALPRCLCTPGGRRESQPRARRSPHSAGLFSPSSRCFIALLPRDPGLPTCSLAQVPLDVLQRLEPDPERHRGAGESRGRPAPKCPAGQSAEG